MSWQVDVDEGEVTVPSDAAPEVNIVRIKVDASLTQAARGLLEGWLVRRDCDMAFRCLAPEAYGCYNESRSPDAPAAYHVEYR